MWVAPYREHPSLRTALRAYLVIRNTYMSNLPMSDRMALKSTARQDAEDFVDEVKRLLSTQDDVIYSVDSSIADSKVISPSTVGDKDAWVEVTLYNVADPDDLFPAHIWVRLGSMGVDVDTYTGSRHNGYNPTVEISKRFDG